ncbi:MAG TPA: SDR family NAD(P)-dependent oxidoreductase [Acidisphaera sp.]|nr:SDR family NAD(P)-dependent oxidoreductase [Acidisphaera sp.]
MTETAGVRAASRVPTAVVVSVGAERGLGAALCRRFAAEGRHVLVAGRTPEKLEQVVRTIRATGGSTEPVATDTTREDDVVRLFDRVMSANMGIVGRPNAQISPPQGPAHRQRRR